MGAPFAQWLGRPSTICFLRRLLATTGDAIPRNARSSTRKEGCMRHVHTATAPLHVPNDINGEEEPTPSKKRKRLVHRVRYIAPVEAHQMALRMSLNSGASLLDKDTAPEEAYKALWHQVNVASSRHLGQLAIDRPEHRENMNLWIQILEHRRRIDGFAGVVEVWEGMRFREVDLPMSGPEAEVLWTTFFHACVTVEWSEAGHGLRHSILEHAKDLYRRRGVVWSGLYKCTVGRMLRIKPHMAKPYHQVFLNDFGMSSVPLCDLAADCATALEPHEARRRFKIMHRSSGQRDLYDRFIPEILKHVDDRTALRWHQDFISIGDGPSTEMYSHPAIQRLFELDNDKSLPMVHQSSKAEVSRPMDSVLQYPALTRTNMSTLVGEVHGIKPKEISDTFVAKMFATRAFSLDIVLQGLTFFGIDKLGPLALHEMALKAGTPVEFCNRLGELKTRGIAIGTSVYGRLLGSVASNGPAHLFQVLLASDQHPEAYEDSTTQESLLVTFLDKDDIPNAHIALLALSLTGQHEHVRAWNRILQHYIVKRDFVAIDKTMRQMQDSKMPPTKRTLNFLNRHVLPLRAPSKAPLKIDSDFLKLRPMQFTTNAYMFAAQNNVYVHASLWRELLKRYGMTERWDECERLTYWLASWYGRHVSDRTATGRRSHWYGKQMLASIFEPEMLKALIHWGFRVAGHRKLLYKGASYSHKSEEAAHEECEPWALGLLLVKKLQRFDIPVDLHDIQRALQLRLLPLFGPAYSRRAINEEARRYNELSLSDYIRHANEICNANIFNIDPALLNEEPPNPSNLMTAVFRERRRIIHNGKDYIDIALYARALQSGYRLPTGLKPSQRRRIWERSPFRLVRRVTRAS